MDDLSIIAHAQAFDLGPRVGRRGGGAIGGFFFPTEEGVVSESLAHKWSCGFSERWPGADWRVRAGRGAWVVGGVLECFACERQKLEPLFRGELGRAHAAQFRAQGEAGSESFLQPKPDIDIKVRAILGGADLFRVPIEADPGERGEPALAERIAGGKVEADGVKEGVRGVERLGLKPGADVFPVPVSVTSGLII